MISKEEIKKVLERLTPEERKLLRDTLKEVLKC
jgi:hypothetical protein